MTLAEKIIRFNAMVQFEGALPDKVVVMNPFRENEHALAISSLFYKKYYSDQQARRLILGINPGRFGAGVTGIPFTDTKRLLDKCGIEFPGTTTHEPSSVFVYDMIDAYGGAQKFYSDFYITSLSPLGFVILNSKGTEVNYNYYDSKEMMASTKAFIIKTLTQQLTFGLATEVCYCMGTGKNYKYLNQLNKELQLFKEIVPLEHPRYIMQYKLKEKEMYIDKYLKAFSR